MNNIIILGNLSYNINLFLNSFPIESGLNYVVKKYKSIGNNINVPLILKKYGLNVYYFSNIGDDYEGKEIINYLKSNDIDINYLNIISNSKTNKNYILRNNKNNSKTNLQIRVNNKYKLIKNINFKPNIIYNDIYDNDLIKQIKNKFNEVIIITHLNEISTNAINSAVVSDYIIIPIKYAQILTNIKVDIYNKRSIIELFLKTKKLFSGKIIIISEELGCIYEKDSIVNIVPKIGNINKISNNSYDIFISTFIYGINNYYSLEKTIKLATISKFLSDNNHQKLNIKEVIDIYEKNN